MSDYDKQISLREKILYAGAKLTSTDRNEQYGSPYKNMNDIASLWTTYIKVRGKDELTGEDVAHMMTLMKIARTAAGGYIADNFVDAATYQAIAGECSAYDHGVATNDDN